MPSESKPQQLTEEEKFEQWAKDRGWDLTRGGRFVYVNQDTEHLWVGWRVRAALIDSDAKAHPPATPDLTQLNNYLGLPLDNQDTTVMVEAVKALRHNVRVFQAAAEAPVISGDQWVSVEERLPDEDDGGVLLAVDGRTLFGWYRHYAIGRAAKWAAPHHVITGKVTHWMSLPSPPEGPQK